MNYLDIDELREKLRSYYGTAAVVMEDSSPFGFIPAVSELFSVDDLSDEEVIEKAKELGLV